MNQGGASMGRVGQHVANALWAAAKLRQQPPVDDLQLLVQAFLQPVVLAAASPQEISNLAWAVSKLCQLPGWQGGVSEQDVQQLLGSKQLQLVATDGDPQHWSNVLLALAGMSAGQAPLVKRPFAQESGAQILALAGKSLTGRVPQDITNTMWACSELGLADTEFLTAAVAAAPIWVPRSTGYDLTQAATACVQLPYNSEAFLQLLLQQGLRLMQQQQSRQHARQRPLSAVDKASLAALCSLSVAKLDMQRLAGAAKELVVVSGLRQQPSTHPSSLRRLWLFHSWLLQHQLLDGKGLAGVLTQQQLQQGEKEAAVYGDAL